MEIPLLLELKHIKDSINNVQYASLYYKIKYCNDNNKLAKRIQKLIDLSSKLALNTDQLESALSSLHVVAGGADVEINDEMDYIYHDRQLRNVAEDVTSLHNFNKLLNIYKRVYTDSFDVDKVIAKKNDIQKVLTSDLSPSDKAREIENIVYIALRTL